MIDLTNTVARNGLIFFPEFCDIVLQRFREDDEEQFAQIMFKVREANAEPSRSLFVDVLWD